MLNWASRFNIFCFLDNQGYSIYPHQYECLLAAGVTDFIEPDEVKELDVFLENRSRWVFGHLSYDLKNPVHGFVSHKKNRIGFPKIYFFVPQFLFILKNNELEIVADDADSLYQAVLDQPLPDKPFVSLTNIRQALSKDQYIQKIECLKSHILRGDCYEINFCQEFYSENASIEPHIAFQKLMEVSPNPFSAFYRLDDRFLLCASPERFLKKEGAKIISQPIKGTIKRDLRCASEDEDLKNELRQSKKDQSENVMVVDLVRNDLSKVCKEQSVVVDELFGIYSFPQVHQMISTVSGELKEETRFSDLLQASFPMGSMTGAPKHRVMQLIDEYEEQSRGLFSGSVGYIKPTGDFDFNVVIRSILYNATENYLSYQVGSGITFYSDAEKEWEECLLKAEAIRNVLALENGS